MVSIPIGATKRALKAVNGISSVDVQGGLEAGAYRVCTIMCEPDNYPILAAGLTEANSNHASVIMPVAQRGAENTCRYASGKCPRSC